MFGEFTSWLGQASEAVKDLADKGAEMARQTGLMDLVEQLDMTEDALPAESAAVAAPTAVALDTITGGPPQWTASLEEWQLVVTAALAEELFCSVAPTTICASPADWQGICETLALDESAVKSCGASAAAAGAHAQPEEATAAWLTETKSVYTAYAKLVPSALTDDGYWTLIAWKLDLCRRCKAAEQLLAVVKMLAGRHDDAPTSAAEPAPTDEPSGAAPVAAAVACPFNEEYWTAVEGDLRALQERLSWRTALEVEVQKEIELAGGNVKLLRGLIAKQDMRSDLAASVAESCSYHKIKLAKLMGDVEKDQDTLVGSRLSADGDGPLYEQLLATGAGIQEALAAFDTRKRSGSAAQASPASREVSVRDGADSAVSAAPTTPLSVSASFEDASAAAADTAPAMADDASFEATSFEAKMPWEDDNDHDDAW